MIGSRVAVVGGGIGGLAAAAFLHRAGVPSVVFEQAAELAEVGAGLVPAPNAVRLLRRIGAMDRLAGRAVPLDVGREFRRWEDGQVRSAEDLAESCERRYGERTYTAHRADLAHAIASAVPPGALRPGKRCTSVEVRDDAALLAFADGVGPARPRSPRTLEHGSRHPPRRRRAPDVPVLRPGSRAVDRGRGRARPLPGAGPVVARGRVAPVRVAPDRTHDPAAGGQPRQGARQPPAGRSGAGGQGRRAGGADPLVADGWIYDYDAEAEEIPSV